MIQNVYLKVCALLLLPLFSTAQKKQDNNWYFGEHVSLNFNSGVPVLETNSAMLTDEGCSSVSDANGNLLFYTDGMRIWDKNHTPMPNANGTIYPGDWNRMLSGDFSSTQSSLIAPVVDYPGRYY